MTKHRSRDPIPDADVREALTLCRLAATAIGRLGSEYAAVASIADACADIVAERTGILS